MTTQAQEKIGDTRYLLTWYDYAQFEKAAEKRGWDRKSDDRAYDYADPAADGYSSKVFLTLDEALSTGKARAKIDDTYVVINKQELVEAHDDLGNFLGIDDPEWETLRTYELDENGVINEFAERAA